MDKIKVSIGKSEKEDVSIDVQKLVTGRTCVIAQSGAGKSYLIAVLCEQLLKHNVPFCIIDTEGEYFSLREKYKLLWIGGSKSDLNIDNTDFQKLAVKVVRDGTPLILDVSDVPDERGVVSEFLKHLYEIADEMRKPYLLMIEEADKFVPQSKESMPQIEEISRRGRKRGLGLLLASQRPALVNKNVLSQCGNQMIGKLTTENDLQAVNLFFGSRKELEELPELEPGEFFVMGDISKKVKTKIKERETKHKGLTPILIPKSAGKISIKELMKKDRIDIDLPEGKPSHFRGIKPALSKEDITKIADAKAGRKFVLFGSKHDIKYIHLEMHPLIYTEFKVPEGIINKKYKKYSFILDGLSGDFVDIRNGLKYHKGFGNMIGMSDSEIKVLAGVNKKGITVSELKTKIKMSEKNVKVALANLEKKNMVDHNKKIYFLLSGVELPNIKQSHVYPATDFSIDAKSVNNKIKEKDIENIIKAINDKAEVLKFELFYYPMYSIYFSNRIVNIDGVTGKEI
ncbi:MAG: DUF87 domain-containing protein [Candidatus Aenigmarchaeota archaeon]|nr:DUF87 domain-containing protein [Candidatus Aenigmarchaeota archaeon]